MHTVEQQDLGERGRGRRGFTAPHASAHANPSSVPRTEPIATLHVGRWDWAGSARLPTPRTRSHVRWSTAAGPTIFDPVTSITKINKYAPSCLIFPPPNIFSLTIGRDVTLLLPPKYEDFLRAPGASVLHRCTDLTVLNTVRLRVN